MAMSASVKWSRPPPFCFDERFPDNFSKLTGVDLAAAASRSLRVRKVVLVRSEANKLMSLARLDADSSVLPKEGTEAARFDCSLPKSVKPRGTRFGDRREAESVLRIEE